jgi:subtilisin family serine protease
VHVTASTGFTLSGRLRRRAIPVALALSLLGGTTPALADLDNEARVIVEFVDDTGAEAADHALTTVDARTVDHGASAGDPSIRPLSAEGGRAAPVAVEVTPAERAMLEHDPRVAAVYDDVPVRADVVDQQVRPSAIVPDDPAWPEQDGTRRIRAAEVWEQTTGGDDVVIAVVDTGIDAANADVVGRLTAGYDFVNDDTAPDDDNGHGTAAATIAAGAGDNGAGVAGLCWRCRIMPVKVLDDDGDGFLSDAAYGIAWAAEHGADIINVSLGSPQTIPLLESALQVARDAGALVVASAGNAGSSTKQWPAADDRAVAVAALDEFDERAEYSNFGPWVDVAAPGCNQSGWIDDAVVRFCGTSSSATLVSGAAALLTSVRGATPATEVRAALRDTAVDVGDGLGSGLIDALAALRAMPSFDDVAGNVHADNIEALAAAGITQGCSPRSFCPSDPVTRGQIATFLDRALNLPDGTASFSDVGDDHPHAAGIAAAATAGVTVGCDAERYCPDAELTRAQMASLLDRALDLADGAPRFSDVAPDGVHTPGIWAVAAAEITQGCAPGRYCPSQHVTRAQMASFLVRALDLSSAA